MKLLFVLTLPLLVGLAGTAAPTLLEVDPSKSYILYDETTGSERVIEPNLGVLLHQQQTSDAIWYQQVIEQELKAKDELISRQQASIEKRQEECGKGFWARLFGK